jgi:thiol-disulfide isomerase/thioredoxin
MRKSIDAMLVNLTNDEKKFNEVTNYLFDLLEKHSLFQASEYLALKVLNEVTCNINSDLAKQLESYRAMKKGNIAPEIDFGNKSFVNGLPQNQFSNLTSINSPYTLVVFGASWCPKCSNELPKLLQNYERWKNLGLEVVYISLDTESNAFEQAVKTYPFFAFCDFKKWDSPVVNDYFVSGTPTFYLLNNKREILLKPISISQMDAWVNTYLKAGQ